jgi:hypothetical protein
MRNWQQLVNIVTALLLLLPLLAAGISIFDSPTTAFADPGLITTSPNVNLTSAAADKIGINDKFMSMPLLFISNQGQADSAVQYYTRSPGGTIYLTSKNIIFDIVRTDKDASLTGATDVGLMAKALDAKNSQRLSFSLDFVGSNIEPEITSQEKAETVINYYIGNDPQKWQTQIPTYREILYKDIYPNINLRLYGKGGAFTYDFIVRPGGNVDDIKLSFNGIDGLDISNRELTIRTALGDMKQAQLKIYQDDDAAQYEVQGDFTLLSDNSYGFTVARYDRERDLVIDPCLMYSTYLGGSMNESGFGIACDSNGNAYISGATASTNFSVRNPSQGTMAGPPLDAFLAKINTNGTGDPTLIYATYIGGNKSDAALGLTLGPAGNVNLAGATASDNFPTTPDAFYRNYRGGDFDGFFSNFSSTTGTLIYSTYFGGSGNDIAQDIRMGADNCVYLTGSTSSSDFSTLNPFQATPGGFSDAFVVKVNNTGFVYSTYLGGNAVDTGVSITGDALGCAYVVGITSSANFPLSNAYQDHINGNIDLFIAKLAADGRSLLYSTYLGGSGYDGFKGCDFSVFGGIALDSAGCSYITGITNSSDFPLQNAYQSSLQGGFDAFLTKLSPDGQSLAYSTYLGGSENDAGTDIAVDQVTGDAYVCGESTSYDFPLLHPIMKPYDSNGAINDAFIVKIATYLSGDSSLAASTCFGGNWADVPVAIALDSSSRVYIAGYTNSWDLPQRTTNYGYRQTPYLGGIDVFVARLDEWATGPGDNKPPYIPEIIEPDNFAGGVSVSPTFSWTGGDPDEDTVNYSVWMNWAYGLPGATFIYPAYTATSFTLQSPYPQLLAEKRYVWRVIATDEHGTTSYSPVRTFFTTKIPPSGVTLDATNIEKVINGGTVTYNATLNGQLDSLGSYDNATCWFTYSAFSTPSATLNETARFSVNPTGVFSQLITGLEPGYLYVFHANIVPPGKEVIDGLMTRNRNFVVGLPAINGTGALEVKAMAGSITRIFTVDQATMPDVNKPTVTFPYGMLAYDIQDIPAGSTVKIILTYSSAMPNNTQYWKCDSVNGWQNITSLLSHNDGDNILELNITDGGLGDADGIANGIITDPGGPAIPATPTPTPTPTPSPTPTNPLIGTGGQTSHGSPVAVPVAQAPPVSLPNIQIQSASISASTVTPGTPVLVTTNIANKSTVNGNKKVTLYVNGQVETTQGVTVNSGSSTQLTFNVSRSEPGDYSVYVDSVQAGSFKVELFRESDGILIFSAVLIALAFLIGTVMIWRRQHTV